VSLPATHPLVDGRTSGSALIRAYRGERPPTPPIVFSGLAGWQPVELHGADGAVLFTDVLLPLRLAGLVGDDGSIVGSPIRSASDVLALRPLDPEAFAAIVTTTAEATERLGPTPLVGSSGAPFTLASFLVDGGPSVEHLRARAMMYADPHSWAGLLNWCADVAGALLRAQVVAGASAARLTDPGIGSLSRRDYQRRVAPHTRRAFDALRGLDIPRVHAGHGSGDVLDLLPGIGATVAAVDRRLPLDEANERLGGSVPVQGNLDPALLSAPWPTLSAHVDDVVERGRAAPAHIVDLGGDVPPGTDPEVLTRIVNRVRGDDRSL
jgi:uroporphyrinogen decarboxylase